MGGKTWTPEQEQALRRMAADHYACDIAKELGRTRASVFSKAHELGIQLRHFEDRQKWSEEMDDVLLSTTLGEAAKLLGVTYAQARLRRQYVRRKMERNNTVMTCGHEIDPPIVQRLVKATDAPPLVVSAPRSVFDLALAA